MKTTLQERLDKATPKWPEVRITLRDLDNDEPDDGTDLDDAGAGEQVQPAATVTVSGVITDVADEAEALTRTAAQARTLGRPIRARITHTPAGPARRVIVDIDGTVTHLDGPLPTTTAGAERPAAAAGSTPITKTSPRRRGRGRRTGAGPGGSRAGGILAAFPAPLRPILKWGVPVVGVLFLASVIVLVVKGSSTSNKPAGPAPVAQIPPPAGCTPNSPRPAGPRRPRGPFSSRTTPPPRSPPATGRSSRSPPPTAVLCRSTTATGTCRSSRPMAAPAGPSPWIPRPASALSSSPLTACRSR